MKTYTKLKPKSSKMQYRRILLLFGILSLFVVAIVVMASYYDYEGYISHAPGYVDYAPVEYAPVEYAQDYTPGYLYNDIDVLPYDGYSGYGIDAYAGNYLDTSVYTGDSASYIEYNPAPVEEDHYGYYYENHTHEVINNSLVSIGVDNNGVINIYPARDDYGVVLDGDYIRVYIPGLYNPAYINITLPGGWTYTIKHESQPRPNTVITFNHNWNAGGSYIGFMPMAVTGLPAGWSQNTL
ncbi:MAG: hypothetical protein FWC92_01160, partial [Defluviitaleaceae bacterium]|nr:hypothetical protein [Defluviitaleaceae bacterium]